MRGTEFAELEAFSAVAMQGSFVKAAAILGISAPTLSQTIRSLEARLGLSLFTRTTRSVALTDAGERLLVQVRPAIDELRSATRSFQAMRDKPLGTLRLSVSNVPATMVVAPVMAPFLDQHPGITLEITVDDSLSDILSGRFDAGIRHGWRIGLEMTAVEVTRKSRMTVLASPDYLARCGQPRVPQDLEKHSCVRFRMADGTFFRWLFEKTGMKLEIAVNGPLIVNTADLMVRAALDGVGLIYLTEDYAESQVKAGRLVPLLEDWSPAPSSYYLYHAQNKHVPVPLRLFLDFLKNRDAPVEAEARPLPDGAVR